MDDFVKCCMCGELEDWENAQEVLTIDRYGEEIKGLACYACQETNIINCEMCGQPWDSLYLDFNKDDLLVCPTCM